MVLSLHPVSFQGLRPPGAPRFASPPGAEAPTGAAGRGGLRAAVAELRWGRPVPPRAAGVPPVATAGGEEQLLPEWQGAETAARGHHLRAERWK